MKYLLFWPKFICLRILTAEGMNQWIEKERKRVWAEEQSSLVAIEVPRPVRVPPVKVVAVGAVRRMGRTERVLVRLAVRGENCEDQREEERDHQHTVEQPARGAAATQTAFTCRYNTFTVRTFTWNNEHSVLYSILAITCTCWKHLKWKVALQLRSIEVKEIHPLLVCELSAQTIVVAKALRVAITACGALTGPRLCLDFPQVNSNIRLQCSWEFSSFWIQFNHKRTVRIRKYSDLRRSHSRMKNEKFCEYAKIAQHFCFSWLK